MGPPNLSAVSTTPWNGDANQSSAAAGVAGGHPGIGSGIGDDDEDSKNLVAGQSQGGSVSQTAKRGAGGGSDAASRGHGLLSGSDQGSPALFYANAAAWGADLRTKIAILQSRQPKSMVAPYPHPQGIPPLGVNLELLQLKAELTQRQARGKAGLSTAGSNVPPKAVDKGPLRDPPEASSRPLRPWRHSEHFLAMSRKSAATETEKPAMLRGRPDIATRTSSKPSRKPSKK